MSGVSVSFELQILVIVAVFACGVVTAAYLALPAPLRTRSQRCAYRRDGSFSDRRYAIERQHRLRFMVDILGATVVLSLPLLFTGFLVHQWLFPADLLPEVISRFHMNPEEFEGALEDEGKGNLVKVHEERARNGDYSPETTRGIQTALWQGWPVLVLAMLVVATVSLITLLAYVRRAVRQFHLELLRRCGEYDITDIEREQSRRLDEANAPPRLLLL